MKRLREILGVKQDALAEDIGLSQQTLSRYESEKHLDEETIEKIATALHVSKDTIKKFDEEAVINIINNSFSSNDYSTMNAINHHCTFNSLPKVLQLYDDQIALYERLLKSEQQKIEIYEKLWSGDHLTPANSIR